MAKKFDQSHGSGGSFLIIPNGSLFHHQFINIFMRLMSPLVVIIRFFISSRLNLTDASISDTAIKKMLATLDDPFTRFLEPEKFKSLRVIS